MSQFDLVKSLVKGLNEGEAKVIRKFLTAFEEVKSPDDLKMVKLLDLLLDNKISHTESEIISHLYKGGSKEAFVKLLTRLKDKIFETLILDVNIFRQDIYSDLYKTKLSVRKLSSIASIVHGRGNLDLAMEVYKKIISRCKEFELYDELLETLNFVQFLNALSMGEKGYNQLSEEIDFYEESRSAVIKAKRYYYELISRIDFKSNPDKNNKLLAIRIKELESYFKKTKSSNVGYYLYYLKIHYFENSGDILSAIETNKKLVQLIRSNKPILMNRRLGSALVELANSQIYAGAFKDALKNSTEAMDFHPVNSFNQGVAGEIAFYAHFYLRELSKAEKMIDRLINNTALFQGDFTKSKWLFFKANLYFSNKEFKSVHQTLDYCKEIVSDKDGWNYGIRLLNIMTDIERGFFDLADMKIENLRKFVGSSKNEKNQRFYLIQQVLYSLVKNSFDFKKTQKEKSKEFDSLFKNKENKWMIKGPELFPFEHWFQSRVNSKFMEPYQPEAQKVPKKSSNSS